MCLVAGCRVKCGLTLVIIMIITRAALTEFKYLCQLATLVLTGGGMCSTDDFQNVMGTSLALDLPLVKFL